MSTTLAKAEPEATSVAPAAKFINPLSVDGTADRVDAAITAMVEAAVSTVEDEMGRHARRRSVAAAMRGVRAIKKDLDGVDDVDVATGMAKLIAGSQRGTLVELFRDLNPDAPADVIAGVVDQFLAPYLEKFEPKARRGKSSGGS